MVAEQLPPVFSPEQRTANEARKDTLAEILASGEAVLFVGAGCSVPLGYPAWPGLMQELEQLAIDCGGGFKGNKNMREQDSLRYADEIKDHIKRVTGNLNRYHHCLYRLYEQKNPPFDELHKMLVRLPTRGIVTTNYDPALDAALLSVTPGYAGDNFFVVGEDQAIRVSEFLMAMSRPGAFHRRVAHLHGRYELGESIVLSAKDYETVYDLPPEQEVKSGRGTVRSWSMHRKVLWTILATRPVVFVGFSMSDPYLDALLQVVSSDLQRWNEPVHYAIMDINRANADHRLEQARVFRREHSVEVVFYENPDERHEDLRKLVQEFLQRASVGPPGVSAETTGLTSEEAGRPSDEIAERGPVSKAPTFEKGSQSRWLEEQSLKNERGIDLHED